MEKDKLQLKGVYHFVHRDRDGNILDEWDAENLITLEGRDYVLDSSLHNTDSVATWYFEIFTDGTASANATYAVPIRTAATTTIAEATRQAWAEGASSSQSVTNATATTITANGALTVAGVGVVGSPTAAAGDTTKGDTACADGVMLSDINLSKTLDDTDTLDITYTISAS